MHTKKLILFSMVGFATGFGVSQLVGPIFTSHEHSISTVTETRPDKALKTSKGPSDPPSTEKSGETDEPIKTDKPTVTDNAGPEQLGRTVIPNPPVGETGAQCPACPCLFSDEILPPPLFLTEKQKQFESNFEGEVRVRWMTIPGAKKYAIHLESLDGKNVKTYMGSRTFIYLKDIPLPADAREANYLVSLATINGKDVEGPRSDKRPLHVKPQAKVIAPEVQEIRVED